VLPELFGTNVRYTGSGIAYNLASILGAAVAPFIATWLAATHGVSWVGCYLSVSAVVTFIALLAMRETKDRPLDAEPEPTAQDVCPAESEGEYHRGQCEARRTQKGKVCRAIASSSSEADSAD
jgi:MFS family permease